MPLNQSVHAEQFLIANLISHGEQELIALAVTAAPCGHCRQFYSELHCAVSGYVDRWDGWIDRWVDGLGGWVGWMGRWVGALGGWVDGSGVGQTIANPLVLSGECRLMLATTVASNASASLVISCQLRSSAAVVDRVGGRWV
jgi:hypothetical protein